jgi:hypothetical protein
MAVITSETRFFLLSVSTACTRTLTDTRVAVCFRADDDAVIVAVETFSRKNVVGPRCKEAIVAPFFSQAMGMSWV